MRLLVEIKKDPEENLPVLNKREFLYIQYISGQFMELAFLFLITMDNASSYNEIVIEVLNESLALVFQFLVQEGLHCIW